MDARFYTGILSIFSPYFTRRTATSPKSVGIRISLLTVNHFRDSRNINHPENLERGT